MISIVPHFKKNLSVYILLFIIIIFTIIFFIVLDIPSIFANYIFSYNVITEEAENSIKNIYQNSDKIAYLTFDDGPTLRQTPKILDILKEEEIQANFFVLGVHVEEYPDILKREYQEGHFIGNHGYSHKNSVLYSSKESFLNELKATDKAIAISLGIDNYSCHLFRFPNGSISNVYHNQKIKAMKYLKEIDYTYIDWNVLNGDSIKKYSNYQLLNNLKKSAKDKNAIVILMHDTGDVNKTSEVLKDSISYLKAEGYQFHTFYDFLPQNKPF